MAPTRAYYDENYGFVEVEDEDDIKFLEDVHKRSRRKKCQGCGRSVRILPEYAYCNSCATKREQGFDF